LALQIDRLGRSRTPQTSHALRGSAHHRAVWEPSNEPNAVRAGWAGDSWRCYSLTPASVDSIPMDRSPVSLRGSRVAAGSHSQHSMRGRPSYVLRAPPTPDPPRLSRLEEPLPKSVPTSDVLCRLAGTAGCRLQPIGSFRFRRSSLSRGGPPGRCRLPAWPGPPLTPPVKETLSTTQNAFRLVSFPQAFACGPTPRAPSVKITCEARTPISPSICHRSRQRSDGFLPARSRPRRTQPFDHVSSLHACFMLARASYGLPCGYPWVATQDAFDRLLLPYHSTPSTRVSSTSVVVARLSPDAPRRTVRFTTLRSASAGPSFPYRLPC